MRPNSSETAIASTAPLILSGVRSATDFDAHSHAHNWVHMYGDQMNNLGLHVAKGVPLPVLVELGRITSAAVDVEDCVMSCAGRPGLVPAHGMTVP